MKTNTCLIALVCFILSIPVQAQSKYDTLWREIKQSHTDDRPMQTLRLARTLYALADKNNNIGQQGRALSVQLDTYKQVSRDSLFVVAGQLEAWQNASTDYSEKAIVHTLQACLSDSLDDVLAHIHYIYRYGERLNRVSAKKYIPLVQLGADDEVYNHRLYPLLVQMAIARLKYFSDEQANRYTKAELTKVVDMQTQLFQQWIAQEKAGRYTSTALLAEILRLQSEDSKHRTFLELAFYGKITHAERRYKTYVAMTELAAAYQHVETLLELYIARAQMAQRLLKPQLALDIAQEGVKRFPEVRRTMVLRQLIHQITEPYFSCATRQCLTTDSVPITIHSKNVPRAKITIGEYSRVVEICSDTLHKYMVTRIKMPPMPLGEYTVQAYPEVSYPDSLIVAGEKNKSTLTVTDVGAIVTSIDENTLFITAINRSTGQPVPNALISVKSDRKRRTVQADKQGIAVLSGFEHGSLRVQVRAPEGGADTHMPFSWVRCYSVSLPTSDTSDGICLTTDRPIYHPGDSVCVRAVMYEKSDVEGRVLANEEMTLHVRNPERTKIATLSCTTDAHGVAVVKYKLPEQGLNGRYSIVAEDIHSSVRFEVADYQAPSFKITPTPLLEDSIKVFEPFQCGVTVRQFTGVPLQQARVRYTLSRYSPWRRYERALYGIIRDSEVLHGEGVTDDQGQFTQTITLDTTHVYWPMEFFTMKYHVVAASGESHDAHQSFAVYGGVKKRPKVVPDSLRQTIWTPKQTYTYNKKKSAVFHVRVNKPNRTLYMMYAVVDSASKDGQKPRVIMTPLSPVQAEESTLYKVSIPYQKEMKNGIRLTFLAVGQGTVDKYTVRLEKTQPDKKLRVKMISFRNQLVPSQPESWKFQLTDATGKPVQATLGVWMYDAALDQLSHRNDYWLLNWSPTLIRQSIDHTDYGSWETIYPYGYRQPKFGITPWRADQFVGKWLSVNKKIRIRGFSTKSRNSDPRKIMSTPVENTVVVGYGAMKRQTDGLEESEVIGGAKPDSDQNMPELELRKELAATAFYYPNLRTDKRGKIRVQFQAPSALTTWHVKGMAHTDAMYQGKIDTMVVTNKPLMVKPLLPRFCRLGDNLSLSTQVSSQHDEASKVTLLWQFFDVDSEKILQEKTESFQLPAHGQKTLSWQPEQFKETGEIGYRVIVQSDIAQDGEQHVLCVLDNKVQVTHSAPFTLAQAGKKQAIWTNDLKEYQQADKLHVELTHGLYSVALQQLPGLFATGNRYCVYGAMHRYYATLVGEMLLDKQPALKAWLHDDMKARNLLDKKHASVVATPWEADQEARRTLWTNLTTNEKTASSQKQAYIKDILDLQQADGRFAWFPGMPGSDYLTTYMLELHALMLMELPQNSIAPEVHKAMGKAYAWLHTRAKDAMHAQQRDTRFKDYFNPYVYLYVWALRERNAVGQEASADKVATLPPEVAYHYEHLPKESKDIAIYNKMQVAIVALAMGDSARAEVLMHSLHEHSMFSSSPHLLSSAIYMTNLLDNQDAYAELLLHALQEARTKVWYGISHKARIVYSLLAMEKEVPATISAQLLIHSKTNKQNGSSQLQRTWKDVETCLISDDIVAPISNFGQVAIENQSKVPLWGVLSATTWEENKHLQGVSSSGLSIQHHLLKEVREDDKVLWRPCTSFRKGDVVRVQLTIYAPQSMSLMQITDRYAGALVPRRQTASFHWGTPSFYLDPKVSEMQCFIHRIPTGKTVVSYDMLAQQTGKYTDNGVEIKSCYAPEYTSSSDSKAITIE